MWRNKPRDSKLKYLILISVILLIVFVAIKLLYQTRLPDMEFTSNNDMPANLHFVMETTIPDLPDKGIIYVIKSKEYSDKDADSLAKAFGLSESITYNSDSNEWLAYQNGELLIINGDTSSWIYRDLVACQKKYTMNVKIPTDEDAVDLAKEYIAKFGINTNSLSTIAVSSTIETEQILQKSIYFYQDVNGYELLGSPHLIVNIGDNGQLEGITNYYYGFEEYETFEFKTVEQVVKELQSHQIQYHGPETVLNDAKIYDVNLAYCQSKNVKVKQGYLVPVFLFSGEVETQTGPAQFNAIVPAVNGISVN